MGNTAAYRPETLEEATASLEELDREIAELTRERDLYKSLSEQLATQIKLKNRKLFAPTSEATDQLQLFNEAEALSDASAVEPEIEQITYRRKKQVGKREADLSKFERVRIDYELDAHEQICPACESDLHDMGVDIRSELTIVPARICVTEHAAHKYACRTCQVHNTSTPIVKANSPAPIIEKSIASPSLVSHIIASKYTLALPLYRQEADWRAKGIDIPCQNMANWILRAADWAQPIYQQMKADLLAHEVIHADETVMQVLREPGKKAAAKSYIWLYRSGGDCAHPLILYDWKKSRSLGCLKEFLGSYCGYIHADGYDAYHKLEGATIVGCMAHVRRKFADALSVLDEKARLDSEAAKGLAYCNALFDLERQWAGLEPDKRFKERTEKSKPLFDEFILWAQNVRALPKSPLGKAIAYLLNQKPYLENVYLDGRLELSNNRAERSIKPFVIGRKNWLFANSVKGARASATLYSIVESAKENDLNVFEYLTYLFEQLPNTTTDHIADLCPHSGNLPERLYVTK